VTSIELTGEAVGFYNRAYTLLNHQRGSSSEMETSFIDDISRAAILGRSAGPT
jgi:hypothetical protein